MNIINSVWNIISPVIGPVSFVTSVKYYIEQQLSKMQIHYYNKDLIMTRLKVLDDRYSMETLKIIGKTMKNYRILIRADEYAWIKLYNKKKWSLHLIQIKRFKKENQEPLIKAGLLFEGIFPPLHDRLLKPFTNANINKYNENKGNQNENEKIKLKNIKKINDNILSSKKVKLSESADVIKTFGKSYLSYLEYWVLQIEALEQDLSIL
jgi:hypothetical protein